MKEAYGDAVWAEEVVRRIRSVVERRHIEHIIIHDLRFTAEVDAMYTEFSPSQDFVPSVSNWHSTVLHTIRIVRPSVASLPIPSEHDLDDYVADTTIENSGTVDELNSKINQLLTNYFAK
jgi:cob(I)alamin adenosyltransferase